MSERVAASFRDPAGFVFRREGVLYRQINEAQLDSYRHLKSSGLWQALITRQLLIPHDEVDESLSEPCGGALVIRPQPVSFISYPYEWSPGQLREAAKTTLEIQSLAMQHGMSLRDASAYNIQFHEGRPTLIDTLSFEPMVEGNPWTAYGQFCRHFLAPLALMRHTDVRLGQLLRVHIDGVPLDLASRLLPRRTKLQWGLGIHIHAHSRAQRRRDPGSRPPSHKVSRRALEGLVGSLANVVEKLRWRPTPSAWRDYYAQRESYSSSAMSSKRALVERVLKELQAELIWDLGANTGQFSELAAETTGALVVAVEMDAAAVELNWQHAIEAGNPQILPILNDLSNPTPAQGWAHEERDSLADRGPADVIMALALIHHLAIGNNVPLPSVLRWLARLGRTVLIEWVPKEDPMVQHMLSTRDDVFSNYDIAHFEDACRDSFDIVSKKRIEGSLRYLYVLQRRDAA